MKKHEFVASHVSHFTTKDENGLNEIIQFKVKKGHTHYINEMFADVDNKRDLRVVFKENRETRSSKQNRLLWAILHDISQVVNGSHTESELMHLYKSFLKEANIKFDYVATTPEIAKQLEKVYRVVEYVGTFNGINKYKLYRGSSQFDTSEMTAFIDVVLRHASELGIETASTTELRSIR